MDAGGTPPSAAGDPVETPVVPMREAQGHAVRAFVFADIRGYTSFTALRGADAAGRVATRLIAIAGAVAEDHDGTLRGTWGDQVLLEFVSPREAVRAAADLQQRCVLATVEDPQVPVLVGVGLDLGEPDAGSGHSAGGLNVASRLCATARAGQVLATAELTHTAGAIEGQSYVDRGRVRLKGLPRPARVVQVRPTVVDQARQQRYRAVEQGLRDRVIDRRLTRWVAVLATAALVAGLAGWGLSRTGVQSSGPPVAADSVAVLGGDEMGVLADVPVGSRPGGIAAGFGSVWTANEAAGTVSRLDPRTRRTVQTIPVGRAPRAVATGAGGVWVTNSNDRTVSWISPRSDTVVKTIPVGNAPIGVAVGSGQVWVTNSLDDTVSVIDPGTGAVVARITVGRRPTGISAGQGAVWVADSGDATLTRINAATRRVVDTVSVGGGPEAVLTVRAGVWVTNSLDGTVSRVDPFRDRVAATVAIGPGPAGLAATPDGVWVTSEFGRLTLIGPEDQVARLVPLDLGARGVVPVGDTLWVTAAGSPEARRGGTLRVLLPFWLESIDPQVEFTFPVWGGLASLYHGLVGYRRVAGPDGGTLVPDLATSLPSPTDGGRTYTFHLQRGVHYSDGRLVRASDVKRGLQRVFSVAGFYGSVLRPYYAGITGASRCIRDGDRAARSKQPRPPCVLSGVVADDVASLVAIHLVRPDGAFLNKLALSTSAAVPPGTPAHDVGTRPIPSTGPYQVKSFVPHHHLLLVRNRWFGEWSRAAQPGGFPDRISVGWTTPEIADQEVLRGAADFAPIPASRVAELTTQHPDQVRVDNSPFVNYLLLSRRRPPFDDARVRRAVAMVVDRARLVELAGGRFKAVATCGMLPPTFPAYRPTCGAAAAAVSSSSLLVARRLVAASGTTRTPVTVMAPADGTGDYLVGLLRALGFRTVTAVEENPFDRRSRRRLQIGYGSYGPDYPSPDAVYQPLVGCSAVFNIAGTCDRALDRAVAAAATRQASDPAGALRAWRDIDRRALADHAYIPLTSTLEPKLVSRRLQGYQRGAELGPLLDQLWVRGRGAVPAGPPLRNRPGLATVVLDEPVRLRPGRTGDVWFADPDFSRGPVVWRFDSATRRLTARVRLEDPAAIVTAAGSAWVSQPGPGVVSRIDLATNKVVATVPVGTLPLGLAVSAGRVWVALADSGTLVAIDPATNRVVATRRYAAPSPGALAVVVAARGALWVTNTRGNQVYRVDPTGTRPVSAVELPGNQGLADHDLQAGAGGLWLVDDLAGLVYRIDPGTARIVARIRVRPEPIMLTFSGGAAWLYARNNGDSVVSRIDPRTNRVVATAGVGHLNNLVGDARGVWGFAWDGRRVFGVAPR